MTLSGNWVPPVKEPPPAETHEVEIRNGDNTIVLQTIYGRLLGNASNAATVHQNHRESRYAPERVQCFACRWTEVSIYDTQDDDTDSAYLVHTIGRSDVPNERDFVRSAPVRTATMIVEALIAKQRGARNIPHAAAMALAEAAAYDDDIRGLYLELVRPLMHHEPVRTPR